MGYSRLITVDLDRESTVQLLRVFFNVPHVYDLVVDNNIVMLNGNFPRRIDLKELLVTFSPSGAGYHIKIPREVSVLEDLRIRALLWDDPYRIVYALKKWTLNPDEKYVDLCFDEKKGRNETELDLLGIIEGLESPEFVRTLTYLLRKNRIEEADKLIKQAAEKLNPHLRKVRGPMYVGCIAFNTDPIRERLEKICSDISIKDLSFKWRMYPCFFPEFDWVLSLFTHDKDVAWKRITWIKNKAETQDGSKMLKDADTRLWVKERIAT